jgi:hypothetical protein
MVFRPKNYGGLGILHLEKFATALRLRWPWLQWKDNGKIWAGTGNPCNDRDMEIFYAATKSTLGNGQKNPFWHGPWLGVKMPKDIAPKIFKLCKRKKWTMANALKDNEWIKKLRAKATLSDKGIDNRARQLSTPEAH